LSAILYFLGTFKHWARFVICIVVCIACNETSQKTVNEPFENLSDSAMVLNQQLVLSERQEIDDFIGRYQWPVITTETGLRYYIYQSGKGSNPTIGDSVQITYNVKLLTGDLIHQSEKGHPVTIILGKRNVVSGLEEGIMMMNPGSKAKMIIPSHLAFGLLGDLSRVPSRAVLVCEVELCSFKKGKK